MPKLSHARDSNQTSRTSHKGRMIHNGNYRRRNTAETARANFDLAVRNQQRKERRAQRNRNARQNRHISRETLEGNERRRILSKIKRNIAMNNARREIARNTTGKSVT